ncbi:hypothetical protein EDC96DRAFT_561789 [Choanephora cucurbitarum]|nr:hypothetical protein EDC96DRAFT_561789 [Choanephora cucurbitarum]
MTHIVLCSEMTQPSIYFVKKQKKNLVRQTKRFGRIGVTIPPETVALCSQRAQDATVSSVFALKSTEETQTVDAPSAKAPKLLELLSLVRQTKRFGRIGVTIPPETVALCSQRAQDATVSSVFALKSTEETQTVDAPSAKAPKLLELLRCFLLSIQTKAFC